ncbi:MAG: HEPN domain-containing protein [Cytophagales bacterium]
MTKQDHIDYWVKTAQENLEDATYVLKGKRYVMALFSFNLVIEKLLKAHWVKDNIDNTPPRPDDLQYLYIQTTLEFSMDDYNYLGAIAGWNLSARYPDYKMKIYKMCTPAFMELEEKRIEILRKCLSEKL